MTFKKEKHKLQRDFLQQLIKKYPKLPCIKELESDKKLMGLIKIQKKKFQGNHTKLNSFHNQKKNTSDKEIKEIKEIKEKENGYELVIIEDKEYLMNENNYTIKDIETLKIIGKWSILDQGIKYE